MSISVRLGMAAAFLLTFVYFAGLFWSPIPAIVPAAAFLSSIIGLRRGNPWSGYGAAAFLAAITAGALSTNLRLAGPLATPSNLVVIVVLSGILGVLLVRAGRAIEAPAPPRSPAAWLTLSAAALIFTATHHAYIVPSAAMEPTVLAGDSLYVRLPTPSYSPARGDIVAFRYPLDPEETYLKRVVAIPGDRLHFQNKTLVLNGVPQSEPYAVHQTAYMDPFRDNFPSGTPTMPSPWAAKLPTHVTNGDLLVPPGKYFVLGDNRDDSLDSRYWGFIDRAAIVGKPSFVYFSAAESDARNQLALPVLLTPSRIRWSRIFHPVK